MLSFNPFCLVHCRQDLFYIHCSQTTNRSVGSDHVVCMAKLNCPEHFFFKYPQYHSQTRLFKIFPWTSYTLVCKNYSTNEICLDKSNVKNRSIRNKWKVLRIFFTAWTFCLKEFSENVRIAQSFLDCDLYNQFSKEERKEKNTFFPGHLLLLGICCWNLNELKLMSVVCVWKIKTILEKRCKYQRKEIPNCEMSR